MFIVYNYFSNIFICYQYFCYQFISTVDNITVYCRLTVVNVYISETIKVGLNIFYGSTQIQLTFNKNVDHINLLTNLYVFSRDSERLGTSSIFISSVSLSCSISAEDFVYPVHNGFHHFISFENVITWLVSLCSDGHCFSHGITDGKRQKFDCLDV